MNTNKLQTPCFVLDQRDVVDNIKEFQNALSSFFPQSVISYSVKTNSLPYILKLVKEQGCYAEVVSYNEYNLAVKVGFPKEHIVYNGPMKSKETFLDAVRHHSIVNIETWREIEWLQELPKEETFEVGVRLNINISAISPEDENHPNDDSRFGFSYESGEWEEALARIAELKNVMVVGIHSHREPKTRSVSFFHNVISYVQDVIHEYNLKLKYWDLGGGFFGSMPGKPTYYEYAEVFYKTLSADLHDISIIVEPGNAVVASGFDYVMEVMDVKSHDGNIYICTDGTRNDVDPFFHKSDYFKEVIYQDEVGDVTSQPQIVSGLSCLEYDRMFTLPAGERRLQPGDHIVLHRVGAYTMSLTPLFIHYFPVVYLKTSSDERPQIIREEWTEDEFLQKSIY
uniref:Rhizoferrin biosystnesis N-citrylornithine decarboxylase FslC n=1 Tax=Prevotella sp. GTC17262 TaxID=3236797 RepID=A0AB33JEW4_9BACT